MLFCGMLGSDPDLLRRARQLICRQFGPADTESERWPFDQTDYYTEEMGPHLQRCFVSFSRLIRPEALPEVKRFTNRTESQIADQAALPDIARPVNLDPGYLDLGKLVLATTKDRSHRIYLGQGIYAEVTLHFVGGAWQVWPWTYPDFHRPEYHAYFMTLRQRLIELRRAPETPPRETPEDPS